MRWKHFRALQVLRKWSPEVGILEHAWILGLGCIADADFFRLDGKFGLNKAAKRKEILICDRGQRSEID